MPSASGFVSGAFAASNMTRLFVTYTFVGEPLDGTQVPESSTSSPRNNMFSTFDVISADNLAEAPGNSNTNHGYGKYKRSFKMNATIQTVAPLSCSTIPEPSHQNRQNILHTHRNVTNYSPRRRVSPNAHSIRPISSKVTLESTGSIDWGACYETANAILKK